MSPQLSEHPYRAGGVRRIEEPLEFHRSSSHPNAPDTRTRVYAVAMKRLLPLILFLAAPILCCAEPPPSSGWKAKVAEFMPLLGHRNWILIVDSAYPFQTSPGVEMIETNADQVEVIQSVLDAIHSSRHVRPVVSMDAELPFVPDDDAPGA